METGGDEMGTKAFVSLACFLLLVCACQHAETKMPETAELQREWAVDDVIKHAQKALNDVESFALAIESEQTTSGKDDAVKTTTSTSELEITKDPLAMHQKVTLTTRPDETVETEFYFVAEQLYVKDGNEQRWFTYPRDFIDELIDIERIGKRVHDQLDLLKKYKENVTIVNEDDHFLLTIEGNSGEWLELIQALSATISNHLDEELNELLSIATITDFSYTVAIDKETFLLTEMKMNLTLQLTVDKEKVTVQKTTTAKMKRVNEVEEIVVPDEVREQAEPFSLDVSEVEESKAE